MILPLRVFGSPGSKLEFVRCRDRADDRTHMAGQYLFQVVIRFLPILQGYVYVDALALDVMRIAHNSRFGDRRMADKRGLHLGRAEPVAGHVDHVVHAAHEPDNPRPHRNARRHR